VRPPEADAFSLVRHASDERISAIDLGWFETRSYLRMMMRDLSMISKPVPALGLATQLSVLRRRREQRPAALRFWEHARLSVSHMK
jgi:hypothetical protein